MRVLREDKIVLDGPLIDGASDEFLEIEIRNFHSNKLITSIALSKNQMIELIKKLNYKILEFRKF